MAECGNRSVTSSCSAQGKLDILQIHVHLRYYQSEVTVSLIYSQP